MTLLFKRRRAEFHLRIGEDFVFASTDGTEWALQPEGDPSKLGPALATLHSKVREATAFDDGRLALSFRDGSSLRVPGGVQYEAWQLSGPAGLLMVSIPDGDLAIWSDLPLPKTEEGL